MPVAVGFGFEPSLLPKNPFLQDLTGVLEVSWRLLSFGTSAASTAATGLGDPRLSQLLED